jgi:bis(5'-nucleosyl)-tetraphosphatase (symmetrical)
MKNIIVYGDIHGCLDEFKKLRKKISVARDDIEISVGDFINKGPYSLQTLHYILKHDIKSVTGNNEAKIIKLYQRYQKEGAKYLDTIKLHEKDTILQITSTEIKYLKSLPIFLKFDKLTILHGGITNDIILNDNLSEEAKKQITLLRYLNKDMESIPWDDFEGRDKFWSEIYDGNEGFILFGHQPFDKPKIDKYSIGLDTGCVYGKKLTAVKFKMDDTGSVDTDNYELISIKSKKDYWQQTKTKVKMK